MSASHTQLQSISILPKRNKWQPDAVSGSSIVGAFFYWFLQWFLPSKPWDLICQISFFCFFIITPTVDETLLCWSKTGGSLQERQVWQHFFPPCLWERILGRQEYQQFGICLLLQLSRLGLNPFCLPWWVSQKLILKVHVIVLPIEIFLVSVWGSLSGKVRAVQDLGAEIRK